MNDSSKKVVRELLPQLVMFLVLAAAAGYQSGAHAGLQFAGIAILTHVLWAPVYYVYLQRRARIKAAKEGQRRREFEADATNRTVRLAIAKAIVANAAAHPAGSVNA
jgi:hypothetical protein